MFWRKARWLGTNITGVPSSGATPVFGSTSMRRSPLPLSQLPLEYTPAETAGSLRQSRHALLERDSCSGLVTTFFCTPSEMPKTPPPPVSN